MLCLVSKQDIAERSETRSQRNSGDKPNIYDIN